MQRHDNPGRSATTIDLQCRLIGEPGLSHNNGRGQGELGYIERYESCKQPLVSSDRPDPNNGNNNATAASTVNTKADLVIIKTADKAIYKPSTLVTYTVNVTNNGSSDARQVIVTDNLPDPKQAIYKSDTGGCVKNATTPTETSPGIWVIYHSGEFRSFQVYVLGEGFTRTGIQQTRTALSSDFDPNLPNSSISTVDDRKNSARDLARIPLIKATSAPCRWLFFVLQAVSSLGKFRDCSSVRWIQ